MIKARSAKAKGTRLETAVMLALKDAGAKARKQPGSGIYSAFPADVYAEVPGLGPILIECKSHKSPLATIRRWLGAATVLVHKADREEALVTVPLTHYCQMVRLLSDTHFTRDQGERVRSHFSSRGLTWESALHNPPRRADS